ncbi:MAG TPA: hypothetical protein PKK95_16375 [Vicinamibacterales bacterium]|nr:hypothetical protein [Vicinamibacterales bacterium]
MSDDGYRSLGVAVLRAAFTDTRSIVPTVRASAERFFRDGDFEGWAALADVDPDRVLVILERFRREMPWTRQAATDEPDEAAEVEGAAPSVNVAGAPTWRDGDGENWEAENAD